MTRSVASRPLAEPSRPPRVLAHRVPQRRLVKLRPRLLAKVQLRVRALPQQKVTQPLLPARAYHEVRLSNALRERAPGREPLRERPLRDLARVQEPRRRLRGDGPRRRYDVLPAAVRQRDAQPQAVVVRRRVYRVPDRASEVVLDHAEVAHDAHADVFFRQRRQLVAEAIAEQRHEVLHLFSRATPVLVREREDRHRGYLPRRAASHDLAQRLDAALVPDRGREPARGRPPRVAVHDERDVPRD
eukprot:31205-Pelagococcus_subviridis.AAC.1